MSISMKNERGVALIIVLLITALLIAMIFEFAYGTRVSLRAAVNFRDSQRAYFLARSGVNFVGALLSDNLRDSDKLLENLEQRDPRILPFVSAGDTELKVWWEDEGGKISIETVYKDTPAYKRLASLFEQLAVSQNLLELMVDKRKNFQLHTQLHQFLGDEDFLKIKDFVTVSKVPKVDINTASSEVLQSLGLSASWAGSVVEKTNSKPPFKDMAEVTAFLGPENNMMIADLDVTSHVFKVNSSATVGGYKKEVEAVITRSANINKPFKIDYWRAQ